MRCESSMEVSQDVGLCDASVQYMFCDAKDFATLIIDFSFVGATSGSQSHMSAQVRFASIAAVQSSSCDPSLSGKNGHYPSPDEFAIRRPHTIGARRQR